MEVYIKRLRDIGTWVIEAGTKAYHREHDREGIVGRIDIERDVHRRAGIDDCMNSR